MRRRGATTVAVVASVALALVTAGCSNDDDELVVLAAASLTEAFTELGSVYEERNPGRSVTFSFAGSSTLVRQALDGAEAGVLVTASPSTMDDAVEGGVVDGAPVVIASNSLVVVVPAGNPAEVDDLADLADPDHTVVLCAAAVPCGSAARALFAAAGITPAPDSEEHDVKAVLAKVVGGEADAGVVYVTDARAAGPSVETVALAPDLPLTTDYPAAVLAAATDPEAAQRFLDLLTSQEGRAVLESYGFVVP